MSKNEKLWLGAVVGIMAGVTSLASFLPRSFGLTALSDIVQSLFLLSGAVAFVPLVRRSQGRVRLFWSLIVVGLTLWLAYQLFWTWYEVVLRRDAPDLSAWDVILFLHMVPLMAALAIRPQFSRDEYSARVGRLDFMLLLGWWFYLYVLIVMPWQYVVPEVSAYNRVLNDLYFAEKLVLLAILLASWTFSRGGWRKVYGWLFAMTFCYSGASTLCNWAIARNTYYTGSVYDIPLLVAMASVTWIAVLARSANLEADARGGSTAYGVWVARCSMIAVFSLPVFAIWALTDDHIPGAIRTFRVSLTLLAAFCMGVTILVRQRILDRELVRLLDHSRAAFDNLTRLQAQILQSEKLASIGQLVGGAAHELNNPITAMLGYSDLLLNTPLNSEQQQLAARIGQHVRRTRSLVASLISFARQAPAPKTALDLNTLARTAVKLSEPHWKGLDFKVQTQFDSTLPKVTGDSNQLLQVCLQLMANCLYAATGCGGATFTVSTGHKTGFCTLQIASEALASPPSDSASDPEDSTGLSACQGILHEHHGRVFRQRREDGAIVLCMELPAAVSTTAKDRTVPVMWQSQPYA